MESYEPLRISRKDKNYRELIVNNDLEMDRMDNFEETQLVFPFSIAVPKTCAVVKEFLFMVHDFCQFSKKSDEQLSNSIEQLMIHLRYLIVLHTEQSYSHANIAQLIQIHQNVNQFIKFTSTTLQKLLNNLNYSSWIIKRTTNPILAALESTLVASEDMLVKISKDKISSMLSLHDSINWYDFSGLFFFKKKNRQNFAENSDFLLRSLTNFIFVF